MQHPCRMVQEKTRAGRPRPQHNRDLGWQPWYVFGELDCLRYVAVLQTKHAQVDARSSQAPQKECGSRKKRACTVPASARLLRCPGCRRAGGSNPCDRSRNSTPRAGTSRDSRRNSGGAPVAATTPSGKRRPAPPPPSGKGRTRPRRSAGSENCTCPGIARSSCGRRTRLRCSKRNRGRRENYGGSRPSSFERHRSPRHRFARIRQELLVQAAQHHPAFERHVARAFV